jgi:hypothetical protein
MKPERKSLANVLRQIGGGSAVVVALGSPIVCNAASQVPHPTGGDATLAEQLTAEQRFNFSIDREGTPPNLSRDAARAFESLARSHFIYVNGEAY